MDNIHEHYYKAIQNNEMLTKQNLLYRNKILDLQSIVVDLQIKLDYKDNKDNKDNKSKDGSQ